MLEKIVPVVIYAVIKNYRHQIISRKIKSTVNEKLIYSNWNLKNSI